MIEWVHEAMYTWGIQRRRLDLGGRPINDGWHVDGWPSRSIAGKTKDEQMGASHVATKQVYPEVLTGEALQVSRALATASEAMRRLAYAHYVVPKKELPTKKRITYLGYKHRTAYYNDLHQMHVWVAARWNVPHETECFDTVATN